jgi:cytochrome b561
VYLGLVQIPDLVSKNRELADALKVVHRVATGSLGSLALIHAAAAVKHHVIDRDDVLARMLPIPKSRT